MCASTTPLTPPPLAPRPFDPAALQIPAPEVRDLRAQDVSEGRPLLPDKGEIGFGFIVRLTYL